MAEASATLWTLKTEKLGRTNRKLNQVEILTPRPPQKPEFPTRNEFYGMLCGGML